MQLLGEKYALIHRQTDTVQKRILAFLLFFDNYFLVIQIKALSLPEK